MLTNKSAQNDIATIPSIKAVNEPEQLEVLADDGEDLGEQPVYAEVEELLEEYSDTRFQKVIRGSFGRVFDVAGLFRKLDRRRQIDWEKEADAA